MNIVRSALLAAALCGVSLPLLAQTIPKGDIVVDVENFATLPTSGGGLPARENVITPTPDGRLFVNDQRGLLYTITPDGKTVTLYLDLNTFTPLLFDNGERGFQSFAFHPDFNVPGARGYAKFYTMGSQSDTGSTATFTPQVVGANRDHDEVLLEWTAADPAATTFTPADAAHPYREVLRIARPNSNHNAGFIAFNPLAAAASADRGNLYLGTGDSGSGGDPLGLAQSSGKAYGAILRIDPLSSGTLPYRVPADNPYVSQPGLLPEKFLSGFRNPQRFTWDPGTGRLFVSDIGQNNVEEIDLAQAGANYGWNSREGDFVYDADGSVGASTRGDTAASGFTYPVAEYRHFGSIGNAVSAGPVVRGKKYPALKGRLMFSDFPTGTPYTIDAYAATATGDPAAITELRLRQGGTEMTFMEMIHQFNASASRADLRFGSDANHRIYLLDKQDGVIRRLVAVGQATVSATADVATLSQSAGGKATITLARTGDLSGPLAVAYTLTGGAVNGRDYALRPLTKTIAAGASSTTLKIKPLAMGLEGKVKLVLQPAAEYTIDETAAKVKITIGD